MALSLSMWFTTLLHISLPLASLAWIWLLPHFPSPSADLSHWPGRSHRDVPSNDPMGCGMDDMG